MDRGVRRIEAVLERAFPRQSARFRRDIGERLAGCLDGVDALAGIAGMPGQAAHADTQVQLPLVGEDRLHAGRLADHAHRRLQAGLVEVLEQPLRAVAAHLLVVADEQMQRAGEVARLDVGHRGEAGGDETLHVGRAARIQPAVGSAQRERIGAPGLAVDRNGIDMTGQRDATRAVRADDGVDVGLLTGGIGADTIRNSMRVQVVADEPHQREIGIAAGRVERHQPGEQVDGAEPRRGGGCIHAAAVYTDCRGRPTDGVTAAGHDMASSIRFAGTGSRQRGGAPPRGAPPPRPAPAPAPPRPRPPPRPPAAAPPARPRPPPRPRAPPRRHPARAPSPPRPAAPRLRHPTALRAPFAPSRYPHRNSSPPRSQSPAVCQSISTQLRTSPSFTESPSS